VTTSTTTTIDVDDVDDVDDDGGGAAVVVGDALGDDNVATSSRIPASHF
jgi:hypothetical protein